MKQFDWAANKALVTDTTGRRLTLGLFKELSDNPAAPFSLEDWRQVYVEVSDPTDYKAAMVLIGQWEHWTMLTECKAFAEHLEKWRNEVNTKLRSEAFDNLRKQARDPKGTAAARFLAEQGEGPKKRGPKKKEAQVFEAGFANDDAKRLQVVK